MLLFLLGAPPLNFLPRNFFPPELIDFLAQNIFKIISNSVKGSGVSNCAKLALISLLLCDL